MTPPDPRPIPSLPPDAARARLADAQALDLLADEAEDVAARLHDPGHATALRLLARMVRAIHGGGPEAATVIFAPTRATEPGTVRLAALVCVVPEGSR